MQNKDLPKYLTRTYLLLCQNGEFSVSLKRLLFFFFFSFFENLKLIHHQNFKNHLANYFFQVLLCPVCLLPLYHYINLNYSGNTLPSHFSFEREGLCLQALRMRINVCFDPLCFLICKGSKITVLKKILPRWERIIHVITIVFFNEKDYLNKILSRLKY